MDYKDALKRQKVDKGSRSQRLLKTIGDAEYNIFRLILQSQEKSDKEEIVDMPKLETEESAEQGRNQQGQG